MQETDPTTELKSINELDFSPFPINIFSNKLKAKLGENAK
jgi:hypothetical protein